jgi:mono/diheme cytochrome c family protein
MRVIAAASTALLLTAAPLYAQDARLQQGQKVYADNRCSVCHSVAGKGNPKGPLDAVGTTLTAEEIRQWLINPVEMTGKTKATRKPPMPPYAKLAKEDIDALVAYLQTLKKG